QRGVDGGGHGVAAEGAQRVQLDHLVLVRHAAVAALKGPQPVQVQRGEALPADAADVAAAALDPQHLARRAVERIALDDLGAGVAAAEVGDAQVRAQQVRAVTQLFGGIEGVGDRRVPAVLEVAQLLLCLHGLPASPKGGYYSTLVFGRRTSNWVDGAAAGAL